MRKFANTVSIIIILFVFISITTAQTNGKIAGVAMDSTTSEPMPGANLYIEGTSLGAASDVDGQYFIVNIPPGTYTLVASMAGYKEVKMKNIIVHSAQTTIINFNLVESVFEGEEIVVVAERPVIQKDITSSEVVVDGEVLTQMASVTNVKDFVGKQAGVEGMLIRGGSLEQTLVMIDGALMVDPTTNNPYTGLPLSSIQEVTIIKGGFNAEYGNVRSGLINIKTKEGEKSKYHGSANVRLGLAHQKHFGPSMFSKKNYYLRPYYDPDVAFSGTQNWPEYMRLNYPTFVGWDKWAETVDGQTAQEAQDLFSWLHTVEGSDKLGQRLRTYGDENDWNIDASFSGPVPFISKYLGDMTFFTSYQESMEYLTVPFVRDNTWTQNFQAKLISHISNNMKLKLHGIYSKIEGVNEEYNSDINGELMTASSSLKQANDYNFQYYYQSSFSPLDVERGLIGLTFEHVLNPSTYYTAQINFTQDDYYANGYLQERDSTILATFGSIYVNESPWNWDPIDQIGSANPDRREYSGNGGMVFDRSVGKTLNAKFDLVSQVNNVNQFKTGVEFSYTDLDIFRARVKGKGEEGLEIEYRPIDWFSREYNAYPWRGSAYVQDKIEIEGLIANVGVRFDYFHSNSTNYLVDPYSPFINQPSEGEVNDSIPSAPSEGILKISPRIGIAHPISENAKLYFNYGHFYSYPASDNLFGILRGRNQKIEKLSNPDAELPKSIVYEVGVELSLFDMLFVNLAGYYKDISNQLATVHYIGVNSDVDYLTVKNQNYEDIRGFELKIEKNRGRWIRGWFNYTYITTNRGDIGREFYYDDIQKSQTEGYYDLESSIRSPVARPYIRANLDIISPEDYGPIVLNNHIFGDCRLSFLSTWKSGSYYSYDPTGRNINPEFENNIQWPDYFRLDTRFTKHFKIWDDYSMDFFIEINNVLNTKNFSPSVNQAFSSSDDRRSYIESLHLPLYNKAIYRAAGLTGGNDEVGELRSSKKPYINDPDLTHSTWGTPRSIVLGLQFHI